MRRREFVIEVIDTNGQVIRDARFDLDEPENRDLVSADTRQMVYLRASVVTTTDLGTLHMSPYYLEP